MRSPGLAPGAPGLEWGPTSPTQPQEPDEPGASPGPLQEIADVVISRTIFLKRRHWQHAKKLKNL